MLSKKLKEYRLEKNMTQEDLAEILCVSRSAVAKWEQGKGIPSKESLEELEKILEISKDELMADNEAYEVIENMNVSHNKTKRKFIIIMISLIILLILSIGIIGVIIDNIESDPIEISPYLSIEKATFGNIEYDNVLYPLSEAKYGFLGDNAHLYVCIKNEYNEKHPKLEELRITLLNKTTGESNYYMLHYIDVRTENGIEYLYYKSYITLLTIEGNREYVITQIELICEKYEVMKIYYELPILEVRKQKDYKISYCINNVPIKEVVYKEDEYVKISDYIDNNLNKIVSLYIYGVNQKYDFNIEFNNKWIYETDRITNKNIIVNAEITEPVFTNYKLVPYNINDKDESLSDNQIGLTNFIVISALSGNTIETKVISSSNDIVNVHKNYVEAISTGKTILNLELKFIMYDNYFVINKDFEIEIVQ